MGARSPWHFLPVLQHHFECLVKVSNSCFGGWKERGLLMQRTRGHVAAPMWSSLWPLGLQLQEAQRVLPIPQAPVHTQRRNKNIWKTVVLVHYCDTQKGGEVFSLSPATFQTLGDSKKSQSPRIIGRLWLTASTFFKKFKYWDISVPVHSVYTNPSCSQLCNWPAFSQSQDPSMH